IRRFRTEGFGTNQIILQVGQPSDLLLNDPPCLRHIDLRIRDSMLHFFPYFRSWDLWGGFPANLAALQLLKEYMAMEIGVADGEIVAASKGLHIYKHVEELAKLRFGKP
ncbi:MAG TPA: thymidylate synthase, partial [Thermodesulfobacteriota bacterium]|nr:thymidylate synthase [Thermodesulfobacteriota bacterium]